MTSEYIGLVPPPEGFIQTSHFNFGRYSEGASYNKVNADLIAAVLSRLPQQSITVVDVAMGHGMVPRLISAQLAGTNRQAHVIGVDLDALAVKQAQAQIHDTPNTHLTFIEGDARDLKRLVADYVAEGEVDYTSIHDAIHEIRDDGTKADILRSQARILRPGGLLSYNSAFTSAAVGREWAVWLMEFMKLFPDTHRYKGDDKHGLPVHTPSFYRDQITDTGLVIVHDKTVPVPQDIDALEGISEYPPFIVGFTERIVFTRPVGIEEASERMKEAIPPTLERLKTDALTRIWHEIIAQQPRP